MQGQVHVPYHFHLAWSAALLATGTKTGRTTFDHTVWIEGHPTHSIFHASNISTYIRATIPTQQPGTPEPWEAITYDRERAVKDIATRARRPNPSQGDLTEASQSVLITPINNELTGIRIELHDDFGVGSSTTTVPTLDLDWPEDIIDTLDAHDTDPAAHWGVSEALGLLIAVRKLVGTDFTANLNEGNGITTFDVRPANAPEARIQGVINTKVDETATQGQ